MRKKPSFPYALIAAFALVAGMLAIAGCGGSGGGSRFIPGSGDLSKLYVSGNASDALLVYDVANSVTGNTAASRSVTGATTMLDAPRSIAVDMARNLVYVANTAGNSILVFGNARAMAGDTAPARSIGNTVTPISPAGLFLDPIGDRLYVSSDDSVLVYDNVSGLNGTGISPSRTLSGGSTTLSAPTGVFADVTRNLLYVANSNNRILVFSNASGVDGGTAPVRTIMLPASAIGIFVDVMTDRLYVSSGDSILVFDGASTANIASTPDRTLSGGASRLNQPRDIFVDTGTDRLYVANAADDTVLVFNGAGTANGSPVPNRVLNLPAFSDPWGIYVDVTPMVIGSTADLDGEVDSNGVAVSVGGAPKVGDVEDFLTSTAYRQFFSFNLGNIPSATIISTATLRLYQASVTNSPYDGALGSVVVDHVSYGAVLDATAYATATLASPGTLSSDASTGYKSLNVGGLVQDDLSNGRSRSQYRLRFSLSDANLDFGDDYAQFSDAEDSCCAANKPPQLVITVRP